MNLYEDFLPYRDKYGLNQLTHTNGVADVSQNGALFTMEYLICLLEDPDTPSVLKKQEIERLQSVYASLEKLPGLTRRFPDSTETDSMDNNGSTLAFSAMFGSSGFAKRMKSHGQSVECVGIDKLQNEDLNKKYFTLSKFVTGFWLVCRPWLWKSWIRSKFNPKFYWNNISPVEFSLRGWYGRSPGFMGKLDLTSQGYTTPFRWFSLLVAQFIGVFADKKDTDARKLPYVTWYFLTKYTGRGQRWFWKLMYKIWVKALLRTYPKGMKDVYDIYYLDPNHPIKKWSKDYFKVS